MALFTAKHVDTKNSEKIHVLFSKRSRDKIIVLSYFPPFPFPFLGANILLEELYKRGYKICFKTCFKNDVLLSSTRRINLFNPRTKEETPTQTLKAFGNKICQVMLFKSPLIAKTMGIRIQDPIAKVFGISDHTMEFIFNPDEEIPMEKGATKKEQEAETAGCHGPTFIVRAPHLHIHNDHIGPRSIYEDASTAGCETESTGSKLTKSETCEAKSSLGIQTMISEEVAIGTDLLEEVKRAVELRIATDAEIQKTDDKVRDWLASSEIESEIPDILTSDDLDRELGNVSEAIIGQKGGEISLRSYRILFPPEAVKTDTKSQFRISLETELLDQPKDLILVSLPIHCSPGNTTFTTPVRLKMPTWIRKADSSTESPPVFVHTYKKCAGDEWRCAKSTELNSSGEIEVECDHFCVKANFIDKADVGRVKFALEHVLYRDNLGQYTSCHFVSSDAFTSSLLKYLENNYKIVHPPTHSTLVGVGDEIEIDIASNEPDVYQFASQNGRVFKIDEDFCTMKRKESIPFLLTPYNIPRHIIEFTYRIREKKFPIRDELKYLKQVEEETPGPSKSDVSSSKKNAAKFVDVPGGTASLEVKDQAAIGLHSGNRDMKGNNFYGRTTIIQSPSILPTQLIPGQVFPESPSNVAKFADVAGGNTPVEIKDQAAIDVNAGNKATTATGLHNTGVNSPTTVRDEARVQSFAGSTVNERNVNIGRITVVVQFVNSHWALLIAIIVALLAVLLYY